MLCFCEPFLVVLRWCTFGGGARLTSLKTRHVHPGHLPRERNPEFLFVKGPARNKVANFLFLGPAVPEIKNSLPALKQPSRAMEHIEDDDVNTELFLDLEALLDMGVRDQEVAERFEADEPITDIDVCLSHGLSRDRTVWPCLCQAIASRQNLRQIALKALAVQVQETDAETALDFLRALNNNRNIQEVTVNKIDIPSVSLVLDIAEQVDNILHLFIADSIYPPAKNRNDYPAGAVILQ